MKPHRNRHRLLRPVDHRHAHLKRARRQPMSHLVRMRNRPVRHQLRMLPELQPAGHMGRFLIRLTLHHFPGRRCREHSMNRYPIPIAANRIERHIEHVPLPVSPKPLRHPIRPGRQKRNSVQRPVRFQPRRVIERHMQNILTMHQHPDRAIPKRRNHTHRNALRGVLQVNHGRVAFGRLPGAVIVNLGHGCLTRILEAER